jgi:hypothetical protein
MPSWEVMVGYPARPDRSKVWIISSMAPFVGIKDSLIQETFIEGCQRIGR